MNNIFNSVNEIRIRILLLLEHSVLDYLSSDKIAALDFITVYGKEFNVSDNNLHGDNRFKYSELPSRRQIVLQAIKALVKDGMLEVSLENGFEFKITDRGINFIDSVDSFYANEYGIIAKKVFFKYGKIDESELFKIIQSKSVIPTIKGV